MNSEQPPLSPERRESARAYRAFCIYRDLGPDRSLDRAWQRFRADQGQDPGSARRPGYWSDWSQRYKWVERAQAYDQAIDDEQLSATAAERKLLRDRRLKFEMDSQKSSEDVVRTIDAVVDKMGKASNVEITQLKRDRAAGSKTITKVKAINGLGMAALIKARDGAMKLAVMGPYELDESQENVVPQHITWREYPPIDPSVAPGSQASDRGPCDAKDLDTE
jgi:hypothetical protein